MQTQAHTLPGTLPAAGGAGRNRLTNALKSYPPELYHSPAAPAAQRPAAQRPSGPAAQRPAARTASRRYRLGRLDSPRAEARTRRARARLSHLPVLALLAGMLSLFAPAPAEAQSPVWEATLTPQTLGGTERGCNNGITTGQRPCSTEATLTDDEFSISGSDYTIFSIDVLAGTLTLGFTIDAINLQKLNSLNFCVGSTAFAFSSSTRPR